VVDKNPTDIIKLRFAELNKKFAFRKEIKNFTEQTKLNFFTSEINNQCFKDYRIASKHHSMKIFSQLLNFNF
jgi:hypothetical protein